MLKKTIFILLFLNGIIIKSQTNPYVVPNVDWIKYFSQSSALVSSPNAIDINSNVYSTGYYGLSTSADLIALKYDSLGTLTYTYSYNAGNVDVGNAIRVDAGGNAYIAGTSYTSTTKNDFVVIKLSPTGSLVWLKRIDGGSSKPDEAYDLAVDASGNVYVTGKTQTVNGYDIRTYKLKNTNGAVLWTHTYSGAGVLDDEGRGIVVTSNGAKVYITGNTKNATNGSDIVTIGINGSTGASLWTKITNGTANTNDYSKAIILLGTDVVTCGETNNTSTGIDYTTLKYDGATGSILWQKQYDFASSTNRATALAKDSASNIGVVGTALNGSTLEYHTILYNSAGTQLQVNKESTGLSALGADPKICNDTIAHHWYVSGEVMNATKDILVYQVTPTGNTAWRKTIDGQNLDLDVATSIGVNGVGVVYVGGQSKNSAAAYDFTTIKISQTPVYFPLDFGTQELNDKGFVFQENKGQLLNTAGAAISNTVIEYYNQGSTPSYYFNKSKISALIANSNTVTNLPDSLVRVDMTFVNANPLTQIYRYNKIDAQKNYFTTTPNGVTNVNSYERLFIPNLYSNIDVHHYSNTKGLKTYFVCKIAETFRKPIINIAGAITSTINGNGELIATTALGTVNYGKLTAYQATVNPSTLNYTILPVTSASWNSLGSNNYEFNVTGYNSAYPMVIYFSRQGATSSSAVSNINNMYWSTFVGGQGSDRWMQSKVDAKDNYYTVGYTSAINFPLAGGAFQNIPTSNAAGTQYGILSKFDNLGALKYSAYFGGTNPYDVCTNPSITQILDVAIDSTYNIHITGGTSSTSMPIITNTVSGGLNYSTNSATTNIPGGCTNGFYAKINPVGSILKHSSYFGGSKLEKFTCIKYINGQIYFGGISRSTSIPLNTPLPNTYQLSTGDGGMYMHLDTSGVLKHVTKVGNFVQAGDADKNGNYYLVSGYTSNTIPVIAPAASFYTASPASAGLEWSIQRFSIADSLTWSTNYGGTANDYPTGISIRDSVMAIVGRCDGNFPIVKTGTDSGDVAHAIGLDVSLVKFNIKTGQRLWSVLHATGNDENTYGCTLDKDYNLYVTGSVKCGPTTTANPCVANNFKNTATGGYYNQTGKIDYDAFILGYNNKNQRKWTTHFGSLTSNAYNYDAAYCVAVNSQAKLFIAGETNSKNNSLPLVRWNSVCYYDSVCADIYPSAAYDAFITMFDVSNFVAVGIKEESKKIAITNNIGLFPNPNSGIFTLRFNEQPSGMLNLNVINILGQKVYELSSFKPTSNEVKVGLDNLTKGIYFITVTEDNKPNTIKFIVE